MKNGKNNGIGLAASDAGLKVSYNALAGKKLTAAIYIRVSTSSQSTDMQHGDLMPFVEKRGWDYVIYEEKKSAETIQRRPVLKQMLRAIRERKIDIVVVWKLDRIFRSLRDLVNHVQEWESLGVNFVSLNDQIDLTTPGGRALLHMLGVFAQFELDITRMRIKAWIESAKERGLKIGRPISEDYSEVYKLYDSGKSIRSVAKQLKTAKGSIEWALERRRLEQLEAKKKADKAEVDAKFPQDADSDK